MAVFTILLVMVAIALHYQHGDSNLILGLLVGAFVLGFWVVVKKWIVGLRKLFLGR